MYTPGKLIYFKPYHFENETASAPKYFLVLKVLKDNAIIVSLPSSQNHVPANQEIVHGCLDIPEGCFNCYIFKATIPITICEWAFPLDTMLYGFWLNDFSLKDLNHTYTKEGLHYDIIGELKKNELEKVIKCFSNSSSVKRKYRRFLESPKA